MTMTGTYRKHFYGGESFLGYTFSYFYNNKFIDRKHLLYTNILNNFYFFKFWIHNCNHTLQKQQNIIGKNKGIKT